MATVAEVRIAVSDTEMPDWRSRMVAAREPERSGSLISSWLVAIPCGCLLLATLCATALSRFALVPLTGSSMVAAEQRIEVEPDVFTIDEVQGEGSLLTLGPALAR